MAAKKKPPEAAIKPEQVKVTLVFNETDVVRLDRWCEKREATRAEAIASLTLKGLSKQDAEDKYDKNKRKAEGRPVRKARKKAIKSTTVKAATKPVRAAAKTVAKPAKAKSVAKKPVKSAVKAATKAAAKGGAGKVSKLAAVAKKASPKKASGVSKFAPQRPRAAPAPEVQEAPEVNEAPSDSLPAVAEA